MLRSWALDRVSLCNRWLTLRPEGAKIEAMKTITDNDLFTAVAEVVKSDPDFVYKGLHAQCSYYDYENNKPLCLFGHAFERLGIRTKVEYNSAMINVISNKMFESAFSDEVWFELSDEMAKACFVAQRAQDSGKSWAEAFKILNKFLNRTYNEEKMMSNA